VTAMTVLKLIAMPPGRIVRGEVLWQGRDLVPLDRTRCAASVQGDPIVFQEPMTSLNPVYTVGDQIAEFVRLPRGCIAQDGDGARDRDAAPGAHSDAGGARHDYRINFGRHAPAGDDRNGALLAAPSC